MHHAHHVLILVAIPVSHTYKCTRRYTQHPSPVRLSPQPCPSRLRLACTPRTCMPGTKHLTRLAHHALPCVRGVPLMVLFLRAGPMEYENPELSAELDNVFSMLVCACMGLPHTPATHATLPRALHAIHGLRGLCGPHYATRCPPPPPPPPPPVSALHVSNGLRGKRRQCCPGMQLAGAFLLDVCIRTLHSAGAARCICVRCSVPIQHRMFIHNSTHPCCATPCTVRCVVAFLCTTVCTRAVLPDGQAHDTVPLPAHRPGRDSCRYAHLTRRRCACGSHVQPLVFGAVAWAQQPCLSLNTHHYFCHAIHLSRLPPALLLF